MLEASYGTVPSLPRQITSQANHICKLRFFPFGIKTELNQFLIFWMKTLWTQKLFILAMCSPWRRILLITALSHWESDTLPAVTEPMFLFLQPNQNPGGGQSGCSLSHLRSQGEMAKQWHFSTEIQMGPQKCLLLGLGKAVERFTKTIT